MWLLRFRLKSLLALVIGFFSLSLIFYKRNQTGEFFDQNFPEEQRRSGLLPTILSVLSDPTTVSAALQKFPRLVVISRRPGNESESPTISTESPAAKGKSDAQGCKLPQLVLNDTQLSSFFHPAAPLNCSKEANWVTVGNGTFQVSADAVKKHGNVTCEYLNFYRVSDHRTSTENHEDFVNGSPLEGDFFKVSCKAEDKSTYSNVHAGIKASEDAIKRSAKHRGKKLLDSMNVYILGFDSVSRMTLMRKMTKFYQFVTETLGGVVLKGYNIVGDGTPQALIPILTGKTEVELPLTRKRYKNAKFVNVYPFVWKNFSDNGYVTLYGEDAAHIGTFTYRLKGFDSQPTDHYMRTFYTMAEKEYKRHATYCLGSQPHHVVHFDYVEKFFDAYPLLPKFAFQFHSRLSHDDINMIEVADVDMVAHLKRLESSGHLNNTMLLIMSDHGHRFASLRETQQGKLEERLPFFSVVMPKWFQKLYPLAMENLKKNAERLTTPFDIHPTLHSILDFEYPPKPVEKLTRGISLFREIPKERSCADAAIEPHWCACLSWEKVEVDDWLVRFIAKSVVEAINKETEEERKLCVPLQLKSIDSALRYAPHQSVMQYKKAKDADGFVPDLSDKTSVSREIYQLRFFTTPGDAHYEASVTHDKLTEELIVDLDVVSHINAYGDAPHCVVDKNYFLIKWCVCPDKVAKV